MQSFMEKKNIAIVDVDLFLCTKCEGLENYKVGEVCYARKIEI